MSTLKELLNLPRFSDLEVLSIHKDLERPVESVEITETPDVANFIPEHVIILTTAMVFRNGQEKLKPFLASLVDHQVAALGIKVGRFIEEIDQAVIDYATEINLPLIKIPSTQPLGGLLYQMQSYLWDSKTEQLTYALDIQKSFSNLLMHDVSNGRFVAELGKIINAPVIMLNPWHKVIGSSQFFSESDHPASFYAEQLTTQHYEKINEGKSTILIKDIRGEKIQVLGYPVKVSNYFPYYLLVLRPEQIPYPISEFAIEQAVLVLTFVLYKNQKVQEFFDIMKSDFLSQLIKAKTEQSNENRDWIDLGENYGLVKSDYYRIALVYCVPNEKSENQIFYRKEESEVANNWLQEQLPLKIRDVVAFKVKNSNDIALLFQSKEVSFERTVKTLITSLKTELGINLSFSFGNPYDEIEEISSSYVEAKLALDEVKQQEEPDMLNYYHPRGLISLFEGANDEDIHYYCEKVLKDLAYPTDPSTIDLRKTLQYYLDYNCEITKTANTLYLHRNTIKYRIKQCEKILGQSVKNPQTSLNLRLALELSKAGDIEIG
ncbi:PucR family transcriptional regulator ligand-binding domain-containing protein [Levilactobacillus brevis]|uniref:PucR family transcriptional regulator ligand-binding domain-containing protein n=1 Tax=Levilactobacillus hammesii TaxID=267633 RepID=A0A921JVH8_9LACO|nr:PucR family transcriptional regulator ligand-binding domain-containing protein [Levilactobacillus brevis]HJE86110.1 PucR family transcriptional regulator ligand-binding domain-containing protein [Levilactobacillus hammesii]